MFESCRAVCDQAEPIGAFYKRWYDVLAPQYKTDDVDESLADIASVLRRLRNMPEEFYSHSQLPVITPSNVSERLQQVAQNQPIQVHAFMSGIGRLAWQ